MDHERKLDLDAVRADDEFLTALSKGTDPSAGEDQLAGMLLDLQREVDAPMPAAPSSVVPLGKHRQARHKRSAAARPRPLVSGLIGAAAATLLIAGVGTVAFDNFVPQDSVSEVELAGDLEELEKLSANGDSAGVMDRVAEMRKRLGISDGNEAGTVTRTRTATPEKETVVETEGRRDAVPGEDKGDERDGEPRDVQTITKTVERSAPSQEGGGTAHDDSDEADGEKEKVTETVVVTETVTAPASGDAGHEGQYQEDIAPEQPSEPTNLDELLGSEPNS